MIPSEASRLVPASIAVSNNDSKSGEHSFISELQSLRGLAALVVLFHHSLLASSWSHSVQLALDVIFNGRLAVVFFFVLSGFVLTRSMSDVTVGSFIDFYVRRLFRIFPAVWVVSVFSLLTIVAMQGRHAWWESSWLQHYLSFDSFSPTKVILAFLCLNSYLIPPLYTVTAELMGSAALPWIYLIFKRGGRAGVIITLLILSSSSFLLVFAPHNLFLLMFLCQFAFGAAVNSLIRNGLARVPLTMTLTGVLAMYSARPLVMLITRGQLEYLTYDYFNPMSAIVEGAGSAILIASIALLKRRSALSWRPLTFLGDISYGVYLIHFPVLTFLARSGLIDVLEPTQGIWLPILTLALTLPLATLLYYTVERPGISLGRELVRRVKLPGRRPSPAKLLADSAEL